MAVVTHVPPYSAECVTAFRSGIDATVPAYSLTIGTNDPSLGVSANIFIKTVRAFGPVNRQLIVTQLRRSPRGNAYHHITRS
jgi:hypothetical protein